MIVFTSHTKPARLPVLVREGWSWGAALFGWVWLLLQGAWIPGFLILAATLAAAKLTALTNSAAPLLAVFLVQGVFGRDLLRWSLALQGYTEASPVAALSHDAALVRLLSERPALADNLK